MSKTKKINLTIVIDEETRNELHQLVPTGKVSEFVYSLIKKELEKRQKEVTAEYQQAAEDKELTSQLKKWDILNFNKKHEKEK